MHNNAIMYLFDKVSYKLSEREIEGYTYPGVASTMKGLLTYPSGYNRGSQFIWGLDSGRALKNKGFLTRKKVYWKKDNAGKFSVIILWEYTHHKKPRTLEQRFACRKHPT